MYETTILPYASVSAVLSVCFRSVVEMVNWEKYSLNSLQIIFVKNRLFRGKLNI